MALAAVAPINAYTKVIGGAGGASAPVSGLPDFQSFLGDAGKEALNIGRAGESLSANALIGKSNLTDVTTAVTSAELVLQGVIAVRDKLVGSIQEVMRMAV